MTEVEVQVGKENDCRRRLREDRFPLLKPLNPFSFDTAPDLDTRPITELSSCEYTKQGRNIILMGESGAGKTHLATALGMEACKRGISKRSVTGCGIANELTEFRDVKFLDHVLKRY